MPIIDKDKWQHIKFFNEHDFLEIGTRNDGAKIIQIAVEGDVPIVALAYTDDPISEDLKPVELWSLMKFSYNADEYSFYDKPKKIVRNLKTIHKYEIPASGEFILELPVDAQILSVQLQKDKPCLWLLINTENTIHEKFYTKRRFCWFRTGEPIAYSDLSYIATVQFNGGNYVSHLFELVVKIDYSKLENLLAAKKWKEADKENFDILLHLCGEVSSPDGRFVSQKGIQRLSCSDIYTINNLWLKYSNGRFGYSVQKSIWQSFKGSNQIKINSRKDEHWNSFCERLGWNTAFAVLNFTLQAPAGHLPATVAWGMALGPILFHQIYLNLFARVEDCNL